MDSKVEENYKRLREELNERLNNDKRLTEIMDKISKGTATFKDSAEYSQIVADHMGDVISKNIGNIKIPMGKEMVCKELLKENIERVDTVFGKVQVSVDEKMGIHLNPVTPPYPTERVNAIAHSLEDPNADDEKVARRGKSSGNVVAARHDENVKANAAWREKAGFDCYLVRDAGGGCCAWCQALEGRYEYASAPDDIFRRHDNCTCTVTYECGKMRQDVWSKRTWEASPEELQARKDAAEAAKPTVNTPEQAKELENKILGKVNKNDVDKIDESGIIENKENRITTIEQASEYLNSVFGSIEKSVYKLDEQLIIDNAEQLRKLNEKFGVLSSDNTGFISGSKIKALAETYNDPSSSRNDLILSSTYFRNPNNLLAAEKIMQERFYSMPVSDEYLRVATITHEYGHMLENEIIRSRIKPEIFEEYQAALARGERRQVALIPLRQQEKKLFHDIYDEIITIAKERNPDFVLKDNLSTYGKKKYYEAFAEMFMNSQCGKPNELGKAMTIFLERSGY